MPDYASHISDGLSRPLEHHLDGVATLASRMAGVFGAEDWGGAAGRWHDLGKFRPAFQAYLRRETGFDDGMFSDVGTGRTEHSIVGARHAIEEFGDAAGRIIAYLIAGHHAGLPDWHTAEAGAASLSYRLANAEELYRELTSIPEASPHLSAQPPDSKIPSASGAALWIRMLFSCLVDADFLDTESFLDPQRSDLRSGARPVAQLKDSFDAYIQAVEARVRSRGTASQVNRIRSEILRSCRERALDDPGLFSLTVPTGGGKTLSSMAFALGHAVEHEKRRIIYVIPYTSIIEQTADTFREIFGNALIEHHSNVEIDEAEDRTVDPVRLRTRLATENWDAPIIVTTAVQFFESLFAARPSRVRKLHNIADSVVVLDEAQLLPPDFLAPILRELQNLTDHFGVTALVMTATQPALEDRVEEDFHFQGLKGVREIIADPAGLHESLKRVSVSIPTDLRAPRTWESIRDELTEHESVLCIVSTRRDCQTLWRLLQERDPAAIHLSALMCGAHRSEVIARIRNRLDRGLPTRVVSTQLIEAGVDVDFPVVYRALAGLDSIAQAAGRCNREGKLAEGQVVVFVPPSAPHSGYLAKAAETTRQLLGEGGADPLAPARFRRFFEDLYWKHGEALDRHGVLPDLTLGRRGELKFAFRRAATKFRLIDDADQSSVVVRYGGGVDSLIERLRFQGPSRFLMRKLQRRMVTVYERDLMRMLAAGTVEEVHEGIFVQADSTAYDDRLGLLTEVDESRPPEMLHA